MAGLIQLTSAQLALLESHYRLLLQWNSRMNLTTVTKLPEAAVRHYCESLFLACHLSPGTVADIGSGPGFPGIPAAILRPDCQFDLIESHQRKAVFLKEAARSLGNVKVLAKRAEDVVAAYDWIISRAVDPLEVLALRTAPTAGGRFALLIGADDAARIALSHAGTVEFPLPWGENRVLALVPRETTR